MGRLRPDTITHVEDFLRCGDLAAGFTRYHCPDCNHEKLLPFTCKSRHFCPSCHQRRTLQTGTWIANTVSQPVPHRQYVLTPSPPAQSVLAGLASGPNNYKSDKIMT